MKTYIEKLKDKNYQAEINDVLKNKTPENINRAIELNHQRNQKIDTHKMPYQKNLIMPVSGSSVPMGTSPVTEPALTIPQSTPQYDMPAVLKGKNYQETNYYQNMLDDMYAGNYAGAKYNEMLHNEKNGYLGLGWENSHIFNYDDPYLGELDRKRAAIENRDPFSYDYREDDKYKTILAQKGKEAEQAYKDGYAQLSRQFDGDIPVNMLNKLQATKSEIIDQADSYIPQLEQLAREMYNDEGNKMLTDYNLTKQLADEDFAKWKDNQNLIISGLENKYARELEREQYDRGVYESDRNYDYNKEQADRNYNRGVYESDRDYDYNIGQKEKQFSYGVNADAVNLAASLLEAGIYGNFDEAYKKAMEYLGRAI